MESAPATAERPTQKELVLLGGSQGRLELKQPCDGDSGKAVATVGVGELVGALEHGKDARAASTKMKAMRAELGNGPAGEVASKGDGHAEAGEKPDGEPHCSVFRRPAGAERMAKPKATANGTAKGKAKIAAKGKSKSKIAVAKPPVAKKVSSKSKIVVEQTRNQVIAWTGIRGPGNYCSFKYDGKKTPKALAITRAQRWLKEHV